MRPLYIDEDYCTSLEQLKGYFTERITPDSDTYADLLDYGKHGDIAIFLRQIDEPAIASRVESIPEGLGDSNFYHKLKEAVTGKKSEPIPDLKPSFNDCFSLESARIDSSDDITKIILGIRINRDVNERYVFKVKTPLNTRKRTVIPRDYQLGKTIQWEIVYQCSILDLSPITLFVDDVKVPELYEILSKCSITGQSDNHDYVDLGLPSGIKWATCNIGAVRPENCGCYYKWGIIPRRRSIDWIPICSIYNSLEDESDAAYVLWGKRWRIPSKWDFEELEKECEWTIETESGIKGYRVWGSNGNSIFLPFTHYDYMYDRSDDDNEDFNLGQYWTSLNSQKRPEMALSFVFHNSRDKSYCSSKIEKQGRNNSFLFGQYVNEYIFS